MITSHAHQILNFNSTGTPQDGCMFDVSSVIAGHNGNTFEFHTSHLTESVLSCKHLTRASIPYHSILEISLVYPRPFDLMP